MKVPLGILCCAVALSSFAFSNGLILTQEEQVLANELMPMKEGIRVAIANSLFGKNLRPQPRAGLTCTACRVVVMNALSWIREGLSEEQIGTRVKNLCKVLNIVPAPVCDQAIDLYLGTFLFIFEERPWLTRFDVCGMLLGGTTDRDCRAVNESMLNWHVHINRDKPPLVETPLVPESNPKTKVIHLTDIHPDLHYTVGSLAECGNYLCCRPHENDNPLNLSISAGPWGDYRDCDMPVSGVEAIFQDAGRRHADAEFVIMTGDLTHHHIWDYTKEDNLAHYDTVFQLLRQTFGNKTIYPVIGNHEPAPCNLFPTREITASNPQYNISWVYEKMSEEFSRILTPSSLATFRQAGYYTQLHRPGFRIVALNTNFCYHLNFFLIHSQHDPENQLQWLSDTLDEAEKNNELVWIIGHVPPGGDSCWYYWGQKYNSIINRYEAIVQAQFYGHTHNDELKIFFDMDEVPPRPTGSLYISTSVTPYSYINPGYKVFYADSVGNENRGATWEIVDYETYVYNVTEANKGGASVTPTLFKEYSAKEAYGVRSLRPADLYDLVVEMAANNEVFQKYYRFWQMSYDGPDFEECTSFECRLEFLCPIVQTDYSTQNCANLEALAEARLAKL